MKRLTSLFTLTLATVSVSAIPLYEPFEYDISTDTNLIGRANSRDGIAWLQAGPASGLTNQPYMTSGSLQYPGHPPGRGNKAKLAGGIGVGARYSFKDIDAALTGTLYYSFLFKLNDSTVLDNNGVFWAAFNNTQGSQTTIPTTAYARFLTKKDITNNIDGNYLVGTAANSGQAGQFTYATNSLSTNDVVFVVVGYTWVGDNGADPDYARLWLNPDPSTFGAGTPPEATITNNVGEAGNARSFFIANRSAAQARDVDIDELLIGNTWAEVTPRTNDMLALPLKSQSVVPGNDVYFETRAQLADSLKWRFNGTDIPGATGNQLNITNVQASHAGTYSVVYSNAVGLATNTATLTVANGAYPRLSPLWSLAPWQRPYLTIDTSFARDQRSIAYSSASNQVFIVSMTNTVTGASTGQVYVLDGTTGTDLYQLNTDETIVSPTTATGNSGNRALNHLEVGPDGSIYGANLTDNANAGARAFQLYRWTNSASDTVPVKVFGMVQPAVEQTQQRWGDTLAVRGSGPNTQIATDSDTGMFGLLFVPTDDSLNTFDRTSVGFGFFDSRPRPTQSRSLFFGTGNTYWQKGHRIQYAAGGPLENRSFDTSALHTFNVLNSSYDVFSSDLGPIAVDFSRNLLAGLSMSPISGAADSVALYNISNLANPILLARYNFPTNHQSNGNLAGGGFGKVVISGDRIYAINANNGVLALEIAPYRPTLSIVQSGANMVLSWSTNATGYTLYTTPNLGSPIWSSLGGGTAVGDSYFVTNAAPSPAFYRLQKP